MFPRATAVYSDRRVGTLSFSMLAAETAQRLEMVFGSVSSKSICFTFYQLDDVCGLWAEAVLSSAGRVLISQFAACLLVAFELVQANSSFLLFPYHADVEFHCEWLKIQSFRDG